MINIDECKTVIFSDGSVRINTADNRYLCLDYSDIKILYKETSMQIERKGLETKLPPLEQMAEIEYNSDHNTTVLPIN